MSGRCSLACMNGTYSNVHAAVFLTFTTVHDENPIDVTIWIDDFMSFSLTTGVVRIICKNFNLLESGFEVQQEDFAACWVSDESCQIDGVESSVFDYWLTVLFYTTRLKVTALTIEIPNIWL